MDTVTEPTPFKKAQKPASISLIGIAKKLLINQIPKKYRPASLDKRIRSYRTVHEPQLMHEAKVAGVSTPLIYMVNVAESYIVMEYVEGQQIKQVSNKIPQEKPMNSA